MASGGTGNPIHVTGELFKVMAGVDLLYVPYRGSPPALTDLIGGRVQVTHDVVRTAGGIALRPMRHRRIAAWAFADRRSGARRLD